jgi:hypothetical protein
MRILPPIFDPSFRYVPAASTSVADTWRRFGWRPTTDAERAGRQRPAAPRDRGRAARIPVDSAHDRRPSAPN